MILVKKTEYLPDLANWVAVHQTTIDRLHNENASGNDLWSLLPSSRTPTDKKEAGNYYFSKQELREILIKEQFGLCCYCMNRIENAPLHTKIEHFLPKETYKPHEVFEYKNLFAACNGGERDSNYKPRVPHCDSAKSDKDPTKTGIISPLSIDCHTHFLYLENGAIQDKTPLGKSTIESLKLDCKRLNTLRKAAIETYLYDESIDFKTEIGQLSIAKNGELQAFCLAIIQVLADYV